MWKRGPLIDFCDCATITTREPTKEMQLLRTWCPLKGSDEGWLLGEKHRIPRWCASSRTCNREDWRRFSFGSLPHRPAPAAVAAATSSSPLPLPRTWNRGNWWGLRPVPLKQRPKRRLSFEPFFPCHAALAVVPVSTSSPASPAPALGISPVRPEREPLCPGARA